MMAREAINTSDNIGVPITEAQNMLSAFIPNIHDIISLGSLFDKRFFKLFFIGVGISGILALCTIGSHRYYTADRTDWSSMYNTGRSLMWTHNYDEAEKCFKAALAVDYIDNAERSYAYGELAELAGRKNDAQSEREYRLKESGYSQFGYGFVWILMASIMLFIVSLTSLIVFRKEKDKIVVGWHQPLAVCIAAYAISTGVHDMAPFIPWVVLTLIASAITFVVLVLSAAFDGSNHPQFVTPSRD